MAAFALECREITKRFPLLEGGKARLMLLGGAVPEDAIMALNDVSLAVPPGKLVGIMGRNGAGKSTLLRILGSVYPPSSGSIRLSGDVGSLFELGGMGNRFITGRECADRVLRMLGATSAQLPSLLADVREFAELGEFFDRRIHTYSSGMGARLYFSIATAQEHDIYLIDEVLSVGDEHFQAKCWRRLRERLLRGASGILVTHDWSAVIKLCENSHVLDRGKIALSGPPEKVVTGYLRIPPPSAAVAAFGGLTQDVPGASGEDLDWSFDVDIKEPGSTVEFAFSVEAIRPGFGWEILILSDYEPVSSARGRVRVRMRVPRLPLAPGEYSLNLFLRARQGSHAHKAADQRSWTIGNALRLVVTGEQRANLLRVPVRWRVAAAPAGDENVAR